MASPNSHPAVPLDGAGGGGGGGGYKRAYKACEACRKTKSRCELAAGTSTCTRCVRERRHCVFPLQRSSKRARHSHADAAHHRRSEANAAATSPILDLHHPPEHNAGPSPHEQQGSAPSDLRSEVVKTFVTSSTDAMGLLFQAAQHNDSESGDDSDEGEGESGPSQTRRTWHDLSDTASPLMSCEARLPPQLSKETLALWNKHRFVMQGWLSAFEAISYLEFFLREFAPLSPVADFFYADHETHKRLILHEPLLCCTILMIASRHLPAAGPAGKMRSAFIHGRLWRHIEHLVQRITFGSEKYSTAKSRTLGSLHALLLIIEWHPRLLHFPPENDGWDASLAAIVDDSAQPQDRKGEAARRWREDVFEPAKRSDRLSWMLVGLAITLAHELGVFDAIDESAEPSANPSLRGTKIRIRRLLYLFSHQLSLRLGCPNMFPQGDHSALQPNAATYLSHLDQPVKDRELLLTKWIDITKLLATATHMFFSSNSATKNMLRSYQYVSLLEHFQPLLARWYEDFNSTSLPTVPAAATQMLLVDYYYTRMYINSIALQALVERASQTSLGDKWLEQDFLRKEYAHDARFINDVRESSGHILTIAKQLSDDGVLSLGSREGSARVALDQLDGGIQALMNKDADDIHLSNRYAELIARHVRKFKRSLQTRKPLSNPNGRTDACQDENRHHTATEPLPSTARQPHADRVSDEMDGVAEFSMLMDNDLISPWDDWLSRPFNPLVAPFGIDPTQSTAGLASDSLDFLWNVPPWPEA